MRQPLSLVIEYAVDGERRRVSVDAAGDAKPASAVRELGLVTRRAGECWRVEVTPEVDVTVLRMRARLSCDIRRAKSIYLNGYQSWTDSWERSVWAAMPGLTRVPISVIKKYGVDWNGDYRFTREDPRPGHQHGFGYAYLRYKDHVLLAGSLDESNGLTTIRESAWQDTLKFDKEPPARVIQAGERYELMGLYVGEGELDQQLDAWFGAMGVKALPANKILGYTSWYRHYGNIDERCLARDFEGLVRVLDQVPHEGADAIFQVDDGYAKVGDWTSPDPEKFSKGMAAIADAAHERGLLAGIWQAPFICEKRSQLATEHPDWVLRMKGAEGANFNWSGALILDTLNPGVREHVANSLRSATEDWGYDLLKLDFLFAACIVPHDGMNRGQLMADAIELIRQSVAPGTRLLLCGVPLMSAFGKCEYCRVGSDVSLDWDDKRYMRLLHRERPSTKRSLANARGRAHLDRRAFGCDPDVFYLRDDVDLTAAQRTQMLGTDAESGRVLLTSDDMGAWDAVQLARYRALVEAFLR